MFARGQNNNVYEQLFSKKAYEIGYALFRISGSISRKSFAEVLERQALSLLEIVSSGEYEGGRKTLRSIEYLIAFGADLGLMNSKNAETISSEIRSFDAAIAEFDKSAKENQSDGEFVNLEGVFAASLPMPEDKIRTRGDSQKEVEVESAVIESGRSEVGLLMGDTPRELVRDNGNGGGIVKAAMRQSAILERIRQNGNCRLKDIQEFLPETSERTIRYDIQNLIEQRLVERMGNGGPATYYRVRA